MMPHTIHLTGSGNGVTATQKQPTIPTAENSTHNNQDGEIVTLKFE